MGSSGGQGRRGKEKDQEEEEEGKGTACRETGAAVGGN